MRGPKFPQYESSRAHSTARDHPDALADFNFQRHLVPHGPEPCRPCVLECPGGFSGGRLNSNGVGFVSCCDLSKPSVSGNA
jgi:hypothetical protein